MVVVGEVLLNFTTQEKTLENITPGFLCTPLVFLYKNYMILNKISFICCFVGFAKSSLVINYLAWSVWKTVSHAMIWTCYNSLSPSPRRILGLLSVSGMIIRTRHNSLGLQLPTLVPVSLDVFLEVVQRTCRVFRFWSSLPLCLPDIGPVSHSHHINLSPCPIWHYLFWPLPDSHLLLTPFFPVLPACSPTGPLSAPFPAACWVVPSWAGAPVPPTAWPAFPLALGILLCHLCQSGLRHCSLFISSLVPLTICPSIIYVLLGAVSFAHRMLIS